MLTLILLVVLGGGAGLMAVGLIDGRGLSGLFGRIGGRSLRRPRPASTAGDVVATGAAEARDGRFVPLLPVTADPVAVEHVLLAAPAEQPGAPFRPGVPTTEVLAYEPVEDQADPLPALTPDRRNARKVPAAYTAVEGSYRDVARVPVWRKLTSLVTLLGILALVGVVLAALAGATFGTIAELVDGAVG